MTRECRVCGGTGYATLEAPNPGGVGVTDYCYMNCEASTANEERHRAQKLAEMNKPLDDDLVAAAGGVRGPEPDPLEDYR